MLQLGTLIAGRYEIQSPLASGGNGLVYSATDRTTEKRVAIKILGPHLLHERAAREKMRLEAIVAGRVESEHIVQVSDAGVDVATGIPFLVMELLKGQDLQHHVENQGPLDPTLALSYLRQMASGLDKAHGWKDNEGRAAPIVHRDLKPENLFLTHREDGSPLVKILDFGLAKVLSVSATLSTEVRGTPLYMAPEQFSQAPVTPATDVWALGLIAFFFLTGKCYWLSGQDERSILPAVLKEVADGAHCPARARLLEIGSRVELPEAFDDWFTQCVNSDPTLRFESAGAAVKSLSLALDQPLVSSPTAVPGTPIMSSSQVEAEAASSPSSSRLDRQSVTSSITADVTARAPSGARRGSLLGFVVAALVVLVAAAIIFSLRRDRSNTPAAAQSANVAEQATPSVAHPPHVPSPESVPVDQPVADVVPGATALAVPERQEAESTHAQATSNAVDPSQRKAPVTAVNLARNKQTTPRPTDIASKRTVAAGVATVKSAPLVPPTSGSEGTPAASNVPRAPRDPADHR